MSKRRRGGDGRRGRRGRAINYEELAHAIRKAEKSHNLLSAGRKPRKADGVVQAKSKSLTTRGTNGLIPSPRAEENYCTTSSSQGEKGQILPSLNFLFCLGPQWMSWGPLTLESMNVLSSLPMQMLILSTALSQATQKQCLTQYLGTLWPSQTDT